MNAPYHRLRLPESNEQPVLAQVVRVEQGRARTTTRSNRKSRIMVIVAERNGSQLTSAVLGGHNETDLRRTDCGDSSRPLHVCGAVRDKSGKLHRHRRML